MTDTVDPRRTLKEYVAKFDTQGDAASALSISQAYLSDLLHGKRGFSDRLLRRLGLREVVVKA